MINFKNLDMSNFMAMGKKTTTVDLKTDGVTLIKGVNKDVGSEGYSSNGAAKTTIMQAIIFAIYGKGIDKLKSDEFVNIKNGKGLVVSLLFEKNGTDYKITRKRKPSSLEFYEIDGEDEKSLTLDSMKNTETLIERVIGVPYSVFMSVFFMSPHIDPFMAMSGTEQRAMMESLLSLDVLTERAERVKEIRKDLEVDKKLLLRDYEHAEETNERVDKKKARLTEQEATYEASQKDKIKRLADKVAANELISESKIKTALKKKDSVAETNKQTEKDVNELFDSLQKIDIDILTNQRDIADTTVVKNDITSAKEKESLYGVEDKQKLEQLQAELELIDLNALDELATHIEGVVALNTEFSETERSLDDATGEGDKLALEYVSLEKELNSLKDGKCHTCKQTFYDKNRITELTAMLGELTKNINTNSAKQVELLTQLDLLDKRLMDAEAYGEIGRTDKSIKNAEQKITNALDNYKRLEQAVESITTKLSVNPHTAMLAQLIERNGTADEVTSKLVDLEKLSKKLDKEKTDKERKLVELDEQLVNFEDTPEHELLKTHRIFSNEDLVKMMTEITSDKQELLAQKQETNPYTQELVECESDYLDCDDIGNKLLEITKRIDHCGHMVRLLTDNKSFIRKSIVDQYIPFVNKKVLEYAKTLGLLHIASINSDLSTNVEYMQKPVSYYNLSQGERLRLNLSVNLAFRDLIAMLGKNSNLLMIDEFFDSACDPSFVYPAYGLIKDKASKVILISHREEFVAMVDNIMTVTKKNGFSFIS